MTQVFASLAEQARQTVDAVYGDAITIGSVSGRAIVIPIDNLPLNDGTELINGARIIYKDADFPAAAEHSTVVFNGVEYRLIAIGDADISGTRRAKLARA